MNFLKLIYPLIDISRISVSALLNVLAVYLLVKHHPDFLSGNSHLALSILGFITADYLCRIVEFLISTYRELKEDFTAGVKNA